MTNHTSSDQNLITNSSIEQDSESPGLEYFETSVFALSLIAVGRLLEIIAKGRASNILHEITQVQVPNAILVQSRYE